MSDNGSARPMNPVFSNLPVTAFTVMSALADEHGAINLGQGFPDGDGPEFVRRAAAEALLNGPNQYPPSRGIPELRRAVSAHNRRLYDLALDADTEVIITSGATEALADCLLALLQPEDEVIVIEPAYDSYVPIIRAAGATPRFVQLHPPEWSLDVAALSAAFSARTKLLILNTPMNPTGKVFNLEELTQIANLLQENDVYAVCDEVYEHLVFDGLTHIPLMGLEGMRERCIRIGSAGKTFSLTGWKIGYICAPRLLADVIARTHQFVTFTSAPALQHGVAVGLNSAPSFFAGLAAKLEESRDFLGQGLAAVGFQTLPTHGTYFISADYSRFDDDVDDMAFCRRLTIEAGVAAIPLSIFYDPIASDAPKNLLRFCFCKDRALLRKAMERLRRYFQA